MRNQQGQREAVQARRASKTPNESGTLPQEDLGENSGVRDAYDEDQGAGNERGRLHE